MPQTRTPGAARGGRTTKRRPPPAAKKAKPGPSKLWVPVLMFALLGCGIFVIVANYFGLLIGGENNAFLLIGIGEVTAGFIVATMLR